MGKEDREMISGDSSIVEQRLFQDEDGGAIPTSPLQLVVREIRPQNATSMNKRWHSRLPEIDWSNITRNTHYVCYGIYFDNNAIGVAIWSSPVAQNRFTDGKTILELRRLALSDKCPKNAASRVLSVMVRLIRKRFPEIKRLISYQDTDVHKGTIYKASGWIAVNENKFISWTNRDRNEDQATGKKIRWEMIFERLNLTRGGK